MIVLLTLNTEDSVFFFVLHCTVGLKYTGVVFELSNTRPHVDVGYVLLKAQQPSLGGESSNLFERDDELSRVKIFLVWTSKQLWAEGDFCSIEYFLWRP